MLYEKQIIKKFVSAVFSELPILTHPGNVKGICKNTMLSDEQNYVQLIHYIESLRNVAVFLKLEN